MLSPSGRYLLTFSDVRLDNRLDLARRLSVSTDLADDALVLSAYERWGEQCVEKLLGDFSFAILDRERGSSFCARDHLGIAQFYFFLSDTEFLASADVRDLLEKPTVPDGLSGKAIGNLLYNWALYDREETFHLSIKKLPPATTMVVKSGRIERRTKYWHPERVPMLRYRTGEECAEHLRELLQDSVKTRLPREGERLAAHLSGGLDSSLVCAMAANGSGSGGARIDTHNWIRPPSTPEEEAHYEWAASSLVARTIGAEHYYTDFGIEDLLAVLNSPVLLAQDSVDLWYEYKVRAKVRESGARVIMTGWGGDEFITRQGATRLAESVKRGRFWSAGTEIWQEARFADKPMRWVAKLCYQDVIRRIIPPRRPTYSPVMSPRGVDITEYLTEDFRQDLLKNHEFPPMPRAHTQREEQLLSLEKGHIQSRVESWASMGRLDGLQYRYPLLDKRVVEFALAQPVEFYRYNGFSRYTARAAASPWVPKEACWRSLKREVHRVSELIPMMRAALVAWSLQSSNDQNQFIDVQRLKESIKAMAIPSSDSPVADAMELMAAIKAVQIVSLATAPSPKTIDWSTIRPC